MKFILATILAMVGTTALASQYNYSGLTGTRNDCTISFDINTDNSLVNLKISGTGLKQDILGLETINFVTPDKYEYYGKTAYDQEFYSDKVFKMFAYEDGVVAKAPGSFVGQSNKMELTGRSINELESIFVKSSDGFLRTKVAFLCEGLKAVK